MLTYYRYQFIPFDRTLELFFTGCETHCPNCQNEVLWEKFNDKTTVIDDVTKITNQLEDYVPITKAVHILGGEPLIQDQNDMYDLLSKMKEMGFKNIIIFTGFDFLHDRKFWNSYKSISAADYIKVGSYKEEYPNTEKIKDDFGLNIVLATTNQKIYKV